MAVDILQELESELAAINEKLVAFDQLKADKERIELTIKFLKGDITAADIGTKKAAKAAGAGGSRAKTTDQ